MTHTEAIKTVCIGAAFLSLATLLLPEREGVRRASLTAFSLAFLLFLTSIGSDLSLTALLPRVENSEAISGDAYEETVEKETLAALKADLCRRFSIQADALTLSGSISFSEDGALHLDTLVLTLLGTGFFADVGSLLHYIDENYNAECEVHFVGA